MKTRLLTTKSGLFLFLLLLQFVTMQAAAPTASASNLTYSSIEGTGLTISFSRGDGLNRIVVVRKNDPVSFVPTDGASYTAADFGTGVSVSAGEYIVYNGSANSLIINGLAPNSVYHIAIFEYNGNGATTEYLVTPLRGNRGTATSPTAGAGNVFPIVTSGNYLRLGITVGNGEKRLVLMRKGAPVNAAPVDLASYFVNAQIGAGNIVVHNGAGNIFDLNNLTTATDYHFAVFEYNGSNKPVYQSPAPTIYQITTAERPTVNSTNFVTESKDGDRIFLRYKLGNGKARIIVGRQGQAVTATPVDGTTYTSNHSFGGAGSSNLGNGQFVVYNGSNVNDAGSNSMAIVGLPRNTTYHFAIYEYDLDAAGKPVYLTTNAAVVSGSTYDEPTLPAKNMIIENITDKSATIRCTAGNGTGRLLIARRGGPVNVSPTDLVSYSAHPNFGYGSVLNGDNYVIADGTTNTNAQRLQTATEYHFAVFEYNGYLGKLYTDIDPARGQLITTIRPTLPASSISFSNIDGNSIKVSWSNGNGKGRVIVARKASAVTATAGEFGDIKDNQVYTANSEFGSGAQIKPGEFVVYNDSLGTVDTRNSFTLTGLEGNTQYYFAVYEYGQMNGTLQYATASPSLFSTLLSGSSFTSRPPITAAGSFTTSSVANRAMSLSWIPGSGEMRIVVAKAGSPVDVVPTNLFNYSANSTFGNGTEIGNDNFVVYKGLGSSVNLTGLLPGITYHFAVYEANGSLAPVFQNSTVTPVLTGSRTTSQRPTVPASAITFTGHTATGFTVNWIRGNGGKSLVVIKEASGVTERPEDGVVYAANNAFGEGVDISTDNSKQYVVYNGTGNSVAVSGLQPAGIYFVTIYEYEEPAGIGTAYLTTPSVSSSKQVVAAPLTQATTLKILSSANGSAQMEWSNGSGQRRIVFAKEGAEVDAVPGDNIVYSSNQVFGSGQQLGSGNYVVFNGASSTITVSNLKPNRHYHFAVFEYNQFGTTTLYNRLNPAKASTFQISTLPVTWQSFIATSNAGRVILEWTTSAELRNKLFEVERSADGAIFHKIGVVEAGTSPQAIRHYNFTDRLPVAGNLHYRIKQIDVDGNFSYSKTIQVKGVEGTSLQILQNPVTSELKLKCSDLFIGSNIIVADAGGREVYKGKVNAQMITIATGHLPAGIYYVKVIAKNGRDTISKSFLRQ